MKPPNIQIPQAAEQERKLGGGRDTIFEVWSDFAADLIKLIFDNWTGLDEIDESESDRMRKLRERMGKLREMEG